jgi:hypothetical protein
MDQSGHGRREYVDEPLQACRRPKALLSIAVVVERANGGFSARLLSPYASDARQWTHDLSPGRGVRAQLVSDPALRPAAPLFQQASQQAGGRISVATRL